MSNNNIKQDWSTEENKRWLSLKEKSGFNFSSDSKCLIMPGAGNYTEADELEFFGVERKNIVAIEQDPKVSRSLRKVYDNTLNVINQDVFEYLRECEDSFDYIHIDLFGFLYPADSYTCLVDMLNPGGRLRITTKAINQEKEESFAARKDLIGAMQRKPYDGDDKKTLITQYMKALFVSMSANPEMVAGEFETFFYLNSASNWFVSSWLTLDDEGEILLGNLNASETTYRDYQPTVM